MNVQSTVRASAALTISHVNLHYPRPEDGPGAALLLETAGLLKTQEMELPQGGVFYRFTTDRSAPNGGDNIIYLSPLPAATATLLAAAREALALGTDHEHPAMLAYRAAQAGDPEYNFHVGFLHSSLDDLEHRYLALQALEANDARFAGRMKFLVNRAQPGDADIDARLDASPIYKGVSRYTYGRNGVQAFCETDLIVDGPLGGGVVLEFDYIFPDRDDHILAISDASR